MKAALILARTDSKRLPNKAISNLGNKKLIQWCIDGVLNTEILEPIIVTSDRAIDLPLIEIAKENNIKYFQGDLQNVAKRVFDCIHFFEVDVFARINGDSPFVNKRLIQDAINILHTNPTTDFVTNLIPRAFPYGLSVEVMRSKTFKQYYSELSTLDFQEHITSWFYQNSDLLNIYELKYGFGNDHEVRFTVDTKEDHAMIENFILNNPTFDFCNVSINELVNKFRNLETDYK